MINKKVVNKYELFQTSLLPVWMANTFNINRKKTQNGELKGLNAISTFHLKWGMTLRPHGPQHARLSVLHHLLELAQTHVHWVGDAIQPSHPLLSSSSPAFYLSQHQGLFQWVASHQVAKVLEFQLQHQSYQWIFRVDFL